MPPGSPPARVVPAHDYHLTLNKTAFSIEASDRGLIVLHETHEPGAFLVTLNGKRVEPVLVNHTFRGIHVPRAGNYRVEFLYQPPGLAAGLWSAAAGVVLLAGFCWVILRFATKEAGIVST